MQTIAQRPPDTTSTSKLLQDPALHCACLIQPRDWHAARLDSIAGHNRPAVTSMLLFPCRSGHACQLLAGTGQLVSLKLTVRLLPNLQWQVKQLQSCACAC